LVVAALVVAVAGLLVGAPVRADATADELYARLEEHVARAETLDAPFARLMLLRSANSLRDDILDHHQDSATAARLVLGTDTTRRLDSALAQVRSQVDAERRTCETAPTRSCVLDEAFTLSEQISDVEQVYAWRTDLATALATVGLWDIAYDFAEQEPDGDAQAAALGELTIALAESGRLAAALQRSEIIWDGERVRVLARIATLHAEHGEPQRARELLTEAGDIAAEQRYPAHRLATVADAWRALGDDDAARGTLDRAAAIVGDWGEPMRGDALAHIALARARLGDGHGARALLADIDDPADVTVAGVALELAGRHADNGDRDAALKALTEATPAMARTDWTAFGESRVDLVARLTDVLRALGNDAAAREVFQTARAELAAHPEADTATEALRDLALQLHERGLDREARRALAAAETALTAIDAERVRGRHRGELILAHALIGAVEEVRRLLADSAAALVDDIAVRLSVVHARAGAVAEAMAVAGAIDATPRRAQALLRIVPELP